MRHSELKESYRTLIFWRNQSYRAFLAYRGNILLAEMDTFRGNFFFLIILLVIFEELQPQQVLLIPIPESIVHCSQKADTQVSVTRCVDVW